MKAGPTTDGDMAFDDVQLTDVVCPPHGFCDFESSFCGWTNLGGDVDQGDWLRGAGASPNPHTGPTVDHTTNSIHGSKSITVDRNELQSGRGFFDVACALQVTTFTWTARWGNGETCPF